MKFHRLTSIGIIAWSLVLNSCTYNDINPNGSSSLMPGDVYLAGGVDTFFDTSGGYNTAGGTYAVYWKNGVMKQLSNQFSQAFAVAVSDTNVHVTGSINETGIGVYWKNGVMTPLPISSANEAIPYAIAVSGSDVFIGGNLVYDSAQRSIKRAAFWKNGVLTKLSNEESNVTSIAVSGTDVYVAGWISGGSTQFYDYKPAYWKNGVLTQLSSSFGEVSAIALSGKDVYFSGNISINGRRAVYWKNGLMIELPMGTDATGIAVSGSDVYVAGFNGNTCYWKNGELTLLTSDNFAFESSRIAVRGSDVYVSGTVFSDSAKVAKVVYWKNGLMTSMPNTMSNNAVTFDMAVH